MFVHLVTDVVREMFTQIPITLKVLNTFCGGSKVLPLSDEIVNTCIEKVCFCESSRCYNLVTGRF